MVQIFDLTLVPPLGKPDETCSTNIASVSIHFDKNGNETVEVMGQEPIDKRSTHNMVVSCKVW